MLKLRRPSEPHPPRPLRPSTFGPAAAGRVVRGRADCARPSGFCAAERVLRGRARCARPSALCAAEPDRVGSCRARCVQPRPFQPHKRAFQPHERVRTRSADHNALGPATARPPAPTSAAPDLVGSCRVGFYRAFQPHTRVPAPRAFQPYAPVPAAQARVPAPRARSRRTSARISPTSAFERAQLTTMRSAPRQPDLTPLPQPRRTGWAPAARVPAASARSRRTSARSSPTSAF